jgi:hypothetical protein
MFQRFRTLGVTCFVVTFDDASVGLFSDPPNMSLVNFVQRVLRRRFQFQIQLGGLNLGIASRHTTLSSSGLSSVS